MTDLPQRTRDNTPDEHVDDHNTLHRSRNMMRFVTAEVLASDPLLVTSGVVVATMDVGDVMFEYFTVITEAFDTSILFMSTADKNNAFSLGVSQTDVPNYIGVLSQPRNGGNGIYIYNPGPDPVDMVVWSDPDTPAVGAMTVNLLIFSPDPGAA